MCRSFVSSSPQIPYSCLAMYSRGWLNFPPDLKKLQKLQRRCLACDSLGGCQPSLALPNTETEDQASSLGARGLCFLLHCLHIENIWKEFWVYKILLLFLPIFLTYLALVMLAMIMTVLMGAYH